MTQIEPIEFLTAVVLMRSLQKEYFAERRRNILDECRHAEKRVDEMIRKMIDQQKSLFD